MGVQLAAAARLDEYYRKVKRLLLRYQSPASGLFPRFGSETTTKVGHVRDTVYACYAVWALHQAYKRIDDDRGRTFELGQSTVKTMRGILYCWMRQAAKVESFKSQQSAKSALHSTFDLISGDAIEDGKQNHHQLDTVAMWLIALVEMIASGLQIIYTIDEVNFIQNLVYYVERAYRTPDYGMWERGSKYHNDQCELHASSVGMTKAALEAINGINLFGNKGSSSSVIYVDIDAYSRNHTTFETLLPRESASKNVDASLLATLSFPCFALHDSELKERTFKKIVRKLQGKCGIKRFLRDGQHTACEDKGKAFYTPGETKNFDGLECEWPMFFTYFIIDGHFTGNMEQVKSYQQSLDVLLKIVEDGRGEYADLVVPQYYYFPADCLAEERQNPGSQYRKSSNEWQQGRIFLWSQSLYIISQLLSEDLLHITELDPIRRHLPAAERPRKSIRYSSFQGTANDLVIQVAIISESMRLQSLLATYGIQSQSPHQVEPMQIWSPKELAKVFEYLGVDKRLGLSGRPKRPIGILGTSKIYRISGTIVLCYPLLFEVSDFYLPYDLKHTIEDITADLTFLSKSWKLSGRPTYCMLIREENVRGGEFKKMLDLLACFKKGEVNGVPIRTGRLQNLIGTSCVEHLDFFHSVLCDFQFQPFEEILPNQSATYTSLTDVHKVGKRQSLSSLQSESLDGSTTTHIMDLLSDTESMRDHAVMFKIIMEREGPDFLVDNMPVKEKLEQLFRSAGQLKHWFVVRYTASVLGKLVDSLMPSITSILVRGKQVTVGVFGHEEEVIDKPIPPALIKQIIYSHCKPYDLCEAVLQQEVILAIGKIIADDATKFEGMLTIRIGWIIHAMRLELNKFQNVEDSIYLLSPSKVKSLLLTVLTIRPTKDDTRNAIQRRQLDGALNRVPKDFYERVWGMLEKTSGGLIVAGYHLPQQPTLSEMTMSELNFSLEVEQLLSRISHPAYRQIMVELFMVVSTILRRNPEVEFPHAVDLDQLIKHAFKEFQKDRKETGEDMTQFYETPANQEKGTTGYLVKVVINSLFWAKVHTAGDAQDFCAIS